MKTETPTDLELMMFADGELEGPRRKVVEAYLRDSEIGRRKLATLGLGAMVTRDVIKAEARRAPDLTDSIMAALESEPAPQGATTPTATVVRIASVEKRSKNGGRALYALGALAAAAAAALLFFNQPTLKHASRTGAPTAAREAMEAAKRAGKLTAAAFEGTATAKVEDAPPSDEPEHGVEVSAVDFGAQSGAIFYVKGDSPSPSITVVWLSGGSGDSE